MNTPHASRGTLVIDVQRCKGCELCVPACPPGVLPCPPRSTRWGTAIRAVPGLHRMYGVPARLP